MNCYFISRTVLSFAALAASAADANRYFPHNLVSDLPGIADQQAEQLINPWDFVSFGSCVPVDSPNCVPPNVSSMLIATNINGTLTQYTPIPGIVQPQLYPNFLAGVTGIMGMYGIPQQGAHGLAEGLLFCTETGTIVAQGVFDPALTSTVVNNSNSGAVYKGCTQVGFSQGAGVPYYYAANFGAGKVDMWDSNLNPIENPAAFIDPTIPAGFAPFNIMAISEKVLLVTYARQDAVKRNDVPGLGNGFLAAFDFNGSLLNTLVAQGPLNSPWAISLAPATFGDFANLLLVGNSGDGKINAFDPATGAWKGELSDTQGNPIAISGLHAFHFGGGGPTGDTSTLYFTAGIGGPAGEPLGSHGLFGSIQAAPSFQAASIENGADFSQAIAPNTWVTIAGGSLSATTRSWRISDLNAQKLPIELDGVSVTVNGEPAYVAYISPTQINFMMPTDLAPGPVELTVTNNGLNSMPVPATLANAAPSFFSLFPGGPADADGLYPASGVVKILIAALHANGSLATSVLPGETVALFGNGFGPTMPSVPNGQLLSSPLPLIQPAQVTIGEQTAPVTFIGLVGPGLYQVNVVIPAVDPKYRFFGVPVVMSIAGAAVEASGFIEYDWLAIPWQEYQKLLLDALESQSGRAGDYVVLQDEQAGAPAPQAGLEPSDQQLPSESTSLQVVDPTPQAAVDPIKQRRAVVDPILDAKGWTVNKWGTEAGVGKNCPYDYLSGKRNLSKANRLAMAQALGLKAEDLP